MVYLVGIYIGEKFIKVIFTDKSGEVLFKDSKLYNKSKRSMSYEIDSIVWLEFVKELINNGIKAIKILSDDILEIGISSTSRGFSILDSQCNAIADSYIFSRDRATYNKGMDGPIIETQFVENFAKKEVYAKFLKEKIDWIEERHKNRFDLIRYIVSPKDFVKFKLTNSFNKISNISPQILKDIVVSPESKIYDCSTDFNLLKTFDKEEDGKNKLYIHLGEESIYMSGKNNGEFYIEVYFENTLSRVIKSLCTNIFKEHEKYDLINRGRLSPIGANGILFLPKSQNFKASFYGISGEVTREDVVRASIEGIVFNIFIKFKELNVHGVEFDEMVLTGELSSNLFICKIFSQIFSMKLNGGFDFEGYEECMACILSIDEDVCKLNYPKIVVSEHHIGINEYRKVFNKFMEHKNLISKFEENLNLD